MDRIKKFFARHFESLFVLGIILICFTSTYFVDQKLAFLNFYFLPIIVAAFHLNKDFVLQLTILVVLVITITVLIWPREFIPHPTTAEVFVHVTVWAAFLIITGACVAKLQDKLGLELKKTTFLLTELQKSQTELKVSHDQLQGYSTDLESRVKERTKALEDAKNLVEELKAKVETALYSTMDSSVAKMMIEGKLRNEKRNVAVMFSDVMGFTSYSEHHTPEQVIRDLNNYLAEMEPIILAYRGHIDKYLGDGIMVEFGAPIESSQYRLMAVLAAWAMQKKMKELYHGWQMRVGLCSGETIMGIVGAKRSSYTTIGDVVNVASRIEQLCRPGSIFIDQETVQGLGKAILYKEMSTAVIMDDLSAEALRKINQLYEKMAELNLDASEKQAVQIELARVFYNLGETEDASEICAEILATSPDHTEAKLLFADCMIMKQHKSAASVKVRGRRKSIKMYEVTGIYDPLSDREKFPLEFVKRFGGCLKEITFPRDYLLPIEGMDGSVGHSIGVAVVAFALGEHLGLTELERIQVAQAGFVADIGKEIVPHHLLNRKGSLSEEEFRVVLQHAWEGAAILKRLGYKESWLIEAVTHSHEAVNGKGVPNGLKDEEIPLYSRIIAVADAYDALTSERPYRARWDTVSALGEIARGVERGQFDARIVSALHEILGLESPQFATPVETAPHKLPA